ncbi:MAG: 4-(cytidine 5'-diphospho)-2-C-methyl-D-erythritol kinase [Candidatus Micrarchaeota archaeon]|nr:4-(cytidine 5'-diphospho)-2-C-methyl-D-erythritol kinase [Candidatus Micrarchaeota archaeon]
MLKLEEESKVLKANAKINLFLHVKNKDERNYHIISTVFQPLELADRIIIKKGNNGIKITSNEKIPLDRKNSVYRAIEKICEKTRLRIESLSYDIYIEKNIPISSGLGGSSVDAAPIIKFLNEEHNLGLGERELNEIASEVGADAPQALYRYTTYAEGYGDRIIEKYELPKRYVSLYIPKDYMKDYPSKTATLYNMLDEFKSAQNNIDSALMARMCLMKKALKKGDWKEIGKLAHNDFEFVVFKLYPMLKRVKEIFKETAECALLSGSGGAVFGIYRTPAESLYASNMVERYVGRESGIFYLTETI